VAFFKFASARAALSPGDSVVAWVLSHNEGAGMDDEPKSGYHISDAARQELSATWLLRFVRDAGYPINQTGIHLIGTYMIGSPTGFHIDVTPTDEHPWITATASDPLYAQNDSYSSP
jgi:hypothetical protein